MTRGYGLIAFGGESVTFKLDLARHVGGRSLCNLIQLQDSMNQTSRMMSSSYLTTTAWDFDGDGDDDIFLQQFFPSYGEYDQLMDIEGCHAVP